MQEKSTIKQNILLYLASKGVSEYRFYKESGITRGVLQQPTGISEDNIARFLAYAPEVSPTWLLTGEGDMFKRTNRPDAMTAPAKLISTNKSDERSLEAFTEASKKTPGAIPLVAERAVGGLIGKDFSIKERDVLAYYVIPKFRHLGVDFMIEMTGDSMMPKFYPGDIIACSIINHTRYIEWNQCHLISTADRGLIVKRLRRSREQDCLLAVSDNSDYEPFDIPKDEILGIARVVGVIHVE